MDQPCNGLRILVAEDNLINRRLISKVLERMGHPALLVENGQEALDALADGPFSMVLMDVQMPIMDGLEATRRIRAGKVACADPDTPIIALTAHTYDDDRERCLTAGMTDHLQKPIDIGELRRLIARHHPADSLTADE
ncbi:response regulator [Desulfovibrio sulfodismutans]|uniref:Response regulator n=1 Tax=Desulfolutivibrio sulfodismutans TaxID=63561 RepID=A0A7K3NKT8_9BACT|nr:response regulator [Desulfolutivibrio sulfodismutans]NDY56814.1 response regulator [Desulfolutivibrio sulfodismutans]QLA10953.1 response regulator [Desulfolutivibrio sulfodismutans DSM 3696]